MEQADRLDSVARQLRKAADESMENILNTVNGAWKSDSAPQYIKKGQKVEGDIRTTAGNLTNIASTIRTIARQVRDAELAAWRIAHARN